MSKININNLSVKELEELNFEIQKKLMQSKSVEIKVALDKNQRYVGKCYRKKDEYGYQYLMVVSALSSNEYHLDCLIFEDYINIKRTPFDNSSFSFHNIFEPIDYIGIRVEDLGLLCKSSGNLIDKNALIIDRYEEISKDLFFDEMDKYLLKLKNVLKENKFNDLSCAEKYIKRYQ